MIQRFPFLATTAALAVTAPAYAQQVPPPAQPAPAPVDGQDPVDEGEAGQEIVVTGQRERGSVPGDIPAEQVLRPADIRAYGAGSLTDLLAELAPQLGSGRGAGGQPVVLLNGRRISGFREIASYPPEAIERVDILPPEAAQQLGYRTDQRVINFVLRRRFNAVTAEVEGGGATAGDRYTAEVDASMLRIARDKRLNVAVEFDARTPIYEDDRDIRPTPSSPPYAILGNITPGTGLTQIDPALSALAGSAVAVAGVPSGVAARPSLGAFLGGINTSDVGAYRTLTSAQRNVKATANYARPIFGSIDASVTAALDLDHATSELGLATAALAIPAGNPFSPFAAPVTLNRYLVEGGPRGRSTDRSQQQLGVALNGDIARWRWSFTGNYTRTISNTRTDNSFDLTGLQARLSANDPAVNPFATFDRALLGDFRQDTARSLGNVVALDTQVNGPLFALPAGDARASFRTGFVTSDLTGRSFRSGVTTLSDAGRDTGTGQARIDLPIANRGRGVLGVIGNLSANASYAYEQTSDFGWLSTYSYGATWSPIPNRVFVLATVTHDENAPSVNQLGDPIVVTPDARVFDFVRGVSVDATAISGGNPNLLAPSPRTFNLTFNARPFTSIDLNFNGEYTRTRTLNPIQSLSTPTAAIEAAFPDRFTRVNGALVRVDTRPINVARTDVESLRWGFNFSRRIGPPAPQGGGFRGRFGGPGGQAGGAGGAARPQGGAPTATVGANGPTQRTPAPTAPPAGGPVVVFQDGPGPGGGGEGRRFGGPGGGFGGRGGFGGGGGGNEGRLQLSVFHTWRLRDTLLIAPGVPELDRLNGDAVNLLGDNREHLIEFNTGVSKSGYTFRVNGNWRSGLTVRGGTIANPNPIEVLPQTTINARAQVNFNPTMKVARDHPWLIGTRVELGVGNVFDTRPQVRDASGAIPINFQPDLNDPVGRTVTLSLRKLFFSRPPQRGGALRRATN